MRTFEIAKIAARSYNKVAGLISSPIAKTDFLIDPDCPSLTVKLERCFVTSRKKFEGRSFITTAFGKFDSITRGQKN